MKVKFVPQNVEFEIKPGESVMHVAQDHGLYIKSVCKGVPSCAECRCRVVEGEHNVLPPASEELSLIGTGHFIDHRRLSCQLKCFGDITVDLSEQVEKQQLGGKKSKGTLTKDDRVEEQHAIRSSESRDAADAESGDAGEGELAEGESGEANAAESDRARVAAEPSREARPRQQPNQAQNQQRRQPREQAREQGRQGEQGRQREQGRPQAGGQNPQRTANQNQNQNQNQNTQGRANPSGEGGGGKRRRRRRGGKGGGNGGGAPGGGAPAGGNAPQG